jgi:beta-ribofuranosylaminobenzene 5'-phosphate synthase
MTAPIQCSQQGDNATSAAYGRRRAGHSSVTVTAAGRLHLGFLDPSASMGRRYGSLGMMIDEMATAVRLELADHPSIEAAPGAVHEVERAARMIDRLQQSSGRHAPLSLHLLSVLPAHAGLGSGTQLALAIGKAFSDLHDLHLPTAAIARLLSRGTRSGIGIAGFDRGGVILDGGPRTASEVPPLLARFDFPRDWRVIIVQDPSRTGLHGEGERAGLARLTEFGAQQAAHLCHLVLMRILPAVAEQDFAPFASGVGELQRLIGEYFAPIQGGAYTSPAVGLLMRWIAEHHEAAVGQSSWGPTAFAIVPSYAQAQRVLSAAGTAGAVAAGLDLRIVAGRNQGADVAHEVGRVQTTGRPDV